MKLFTALLFFGCAFIYAADIQSDVKEIINAEFTEFCDLSLQKFQLPVDLKSDTEHLVQQKFYANYVYIWKICGQDSLKGYAILDNTYGKSLPITFLVIFSPAGEILRVDIIRYREPYGGAVASRRWLDHFTGKSSSDDFRIGKEIDAISGATISVNSVTRAVQKLTHVIAHIKSNKLLICPDTALPSQSSAK